MPFVNRGLLELYGAVAVGSSSTGTYRPATPGRPGAVRASRRPNTSRRMRETGAAPDGRRIRRDPETGVLSERLPHVTRMQTHIVPVGFDYDRLIAP